MGVLVISDNSHKGGFTLRSRVKPGERRVKTGMIARS